MFFSFGATGERQLTFLKRNRSWQRSSRKEETNVEGEVLLYPED